MKVNDYGEILEATESELRKKYFNEEYYRVFDYDSYIEQIKKNGTKIIQG